jgi:hypothetical protein
VYAQVEDAMYLSMKWTKWSSSGDGVGGRGRDDGDEKGFAFGRPHHTTITTTAITTTTTTTTTTTYHHWYV